MNIKKQLLILLALLVCAPAWAGSVLKVFALQHRFADELIPLIAPMVGEYGTVTGLNTRLIVRTDDSQIGEIEDLVHELDVARVNRRITIQSNQQATSDNTSVETNGRVVIRRRTFGNVQVSGNSSQSNSRQSSQQFINVIDGGHAFIKVGQLVPYTQDWITLTRRYAQLHATTEWLEVTTGFAVSPRTIGNQVELKITPRIARLNSRDFVDFTSLSTTIQVGLGEWVDIGGLMQDHDDVSHQILGFQRRNGRSSQSLKVKVD